VEKDLRPDTVPDAIWDLPATNTETQRPDLQKMRKRCFSSRLLEFCLGRCRLRRTVKRGAAKINGFSEVPIAI
jgi:hypothetical protein